MGLERNGVALMGRLRRPRVLLPILRASPPQRIQRIKTGVRPPKTGVRPPPTRSGTPVAKDERAMKQRILENLTTTERLTLLEQIFAPGAGARLEQSSCRLSDMEWMFDFDVVNLVECRYTYDNANDLFGELRNMLMPIQGIHPNYGLLCFIHIIMSDGNSDNEAFSREILRFIDDCKSLDMVFDHFFSTSSYKEVITLRVVFVDDEKQENIRDWVTKDSRI